MALFDLGKYKTFVWKGTNRWNKKTHGIIIAEDLFSAEIESRKLGVNVTYLKERPFWLLPGSTTNPVKIIDIVHSMRQLSTLINAGIPLVQALEALTVGSEKVRLRILFFKLRDEVASGKTFAEALATYPQLFSQLVRGLINSGEQSGTLDKMTIEVANYLEHQERLKNKVKRAMYYPALVITVALGVILTMLIFLIPRFEKIYASFNAKLPAFTLKVIGLSQLIREDWWKLLLGLILLIWLIHRFNEKSLGFRRMKDNLMLHLPLFGSLIQRSLIAHICSTLSITLKAGIPLMDALSRCAKVPTNLLFNEAILFARDQVEQGESMANAFRETQLFPPMVTQMIEVGEKSGSLDHMLEKAAEYYSEQVDSAVDGLTTIIEPLLIVMIAGVVGVFLFAMYLPIFNIGMIIK